MELLDEKKLLTTKKLTPKLFHQKSVKSNHSKDSNGRPFIPPSSLVKIQKRAIFKNGYCNVKGSKISGTKKFKYIQDIFTTLIDAKWRWTILVFCMVFFVTFYIFALLYWWISINHGDLNPENLPNLQKKSGWKPCITEIYNFTSIFLYSVETQITTGYGSRAITEECIDTIILMCIHSIIAMLMQSFVIGVAFAKLTRPKLRTQTIIFSKNAVISLRDTKLCLMFRIGDIRKTHIIDTKIRAQLIGTRKTKEGELIKNYQTELNLKTEDNNDGNIFFIWPTTIIHIIDKTSPFYYLSACDILQDNFEILIILEGIIESTGQTIQARSSYISKEILWGHTFKSIINFNKNLGGYQINYTKFDQTKPIDTPLCSAAEFDEYKRINL